MKNYIILLVMLLSCNTPPQPTPEVKTPVEAKNFFTLTDYKDVVHTYDKPIVIKHLQTDTLYCKSCHRWEVIRAVWISDKNDYDYFVGVHYKD